MQGNSTPSKRAAIYCRVSSAGQEDKYSLPTQEAACREYATAHGYSVAAVYQDVHTGAEYRERPELSALRGCIRRRELDAVIVYAIDRLSRDSTHIGVLYDEAEHCGAAFFFVTEDFDSTPVGKLIRDAKGFAAAIEREKTRERTARGHLARVQSGKLRPGSRPLYGYKWRDGTKGAYEIDDDTAWVVQRIFAELATGKALRKVADGLNADAIPTPNGAARWLHTSIRQIAQHPGYAGTAVANTHKVEKLDGKHKRIARPASEHVSLPEGTIPPLVTPEQAAAIRLRAAQNKTEAKRTNRDPESFLLRAGFVKCGHCGRTVHAAWRRNGRGGHLGRPIYEVLSRSTEHYNCPNASISARKLDAAVWQFATNIMLRPTLILKRMAALTEQGEAAAELASIDRSLARVEKQQANLARQLTHFDDDDDETAAPMRAHMKALGQERKELQAERVKVAAQYEAWEREKAATRAIVEEMRELQRGIVEDGAAATVREIGAAAMQKLRAMSYEEKRERLRRLGVTVYLYPDSAPDRFIVKSSHAAQTVDTSA